MKYVIQYTYDWIQLGCDCCTDVIREMEVYDAHGTTVYETEFAPYLEGEKYLREWVNENYPEYKNFDVHEDTTFA